MMDININRYTNFLYTTLIGGNIDIKYIKIYSGLLNNIKEFSLVCGLPDCEFSTGYHSSENLEDSVIILLTNIRKIYNETKIYSELSEEKKIIVRLML